MYMGQAVLVRMCLSYVWQVTPEERTESCETYQERDYSGQGSRCASHPLDIASLLQISGRKASSAITHAKSSETMSLDNLGAGVEQQWSSPFAQTWPASV